MTRKTRKRESQQDQPAKSTTSSVLPMEIRIGDRFTAQGHEWEVLTRPTAMHGAKNLWARVVRPGLPESERQVVRVAHQRVEVRRSPGSER